MIQYTAGDMAAFAGCALMMAAEDRRSGKKASWGSVYSRVVPVVAWALELAIVVISARILQTG